MLHGAGWEVSFQELPELDHFEIIWELMRDCRLIQVGPSPVGRGLPGQMPQLALQENGAHAG